MIIEIVKNLSFFIPLLIFLLGYLKERYTKKKDEKKQLKENVNYIYFLLKEIRENISTYPDFLLMASKKISDNPFENIKIMFNSQTKGMIQRAHKLEPKEIYKGLELYKNPSTYKKIYKELDFLPPFIESLDTVITNYQKNKFEFKKTFRDKHESLKSYNVSLIYKLKKQKSDKEFVDYMFNIINEYLSDDNKNYNDILDLYIRPISTEIKKNYRDRDFALEIIEKTKELEILYNQFISDSKMYSQEFESLSYEVLESIKEIDNCILELEKAIT